MSSVDSTGNPASGLATYMILRRLTTDEPNYAWEHIDSIEARGAEHAIRRSVARQTDQGGVYVAIPVRSWKPMSVKAEQTTTLRLDAA